MGKAVERIFLPLMKLTIPELVDSICPLKRVPHLMLVSIRSPSGRRAR